MQCLEEDAEGEKEETGLAPHGRDRGQPSDLFLSFYLIQLLICDESIRQKAQRVDGFLFVFKQYVFFLFCDLEVRPNIKDLPDQQLKQLCLPEDNMWGISLPDKRIVIHGLCCLAWVTSQQGRGKGRGEEL